VAADERERERERESEGGREKWRRGEAVTRTARKSLKHR
jgi:hypothetical protein